LYRKARRRWCVEISGKQINLGPAGHAVAGIDARGSRSTTLYDNVGQVTAGVDPLSNRSSFMYDAAGRQIATEDPLNHINTTGYDPGGQVVAVHSAKPALCEPANGAV